MVIRPLNRDAAPEIELVASRMRQTLQEVLDPERGRQMYTMDWLRDRVRFHLTPDTGAVLLAVDGPTIAGHIIVRTEQDERGRFGLVSTIFVLPQYRRLGVASKLLSEGQAWLADAGHRRFATHTAVGNRPLIRLFERHGYHVTMAEELMVRLSYSASAAEQ